MHKLKEVFENHSIWILIGFFFAIMVLAIAALTGVTYTDVIRTF